MAHPLRIGALLAAFGAALLAGCTNDCDVICEKQLDCAGGAEQADVQVCRDQCLRDMEADGSADEIDACARCVESHSCDELQPGGDELGSCGKECN